MIAALGRVFVVLWVLHVARVFAGQTAGTSVSEFLPLGLARLEEGKFQEAVELLEKAASQPQAHPQTYRFLAKAYEGVRGWQRAAESCERFASFGLADAEQVKRHAAYVRRFDEFASDALVGLTAEQEGTLKEVASDPYVHGLVRFAACDRLGQQYYSAGKLDLAEQFYKRLTDAPSAFRSGRFLSDYAEIQRRRGNLAECLKLLEELNRTPEKDLLDAPRAAARTYGEWGRTLATAKNWKEAEAKFARAAQFVPHAFLLDHVDACLRTAGFQKAASLLEQALPQAPRSGGETSSAGAAPADSVPHAGVIQKKLAGVYMAWAEWSEARRQYARAAELYRLAKDFDPAAKPCLAPEEIADGEEETAKRMLQDALHLMEVKKQYGPAFRKLQAVAVNFPGTEAAVEAQYHTGMCYWWLRQFEDSAETFRKFYRTHPKHRLAPQAWIVRLRVLVSLERFREAAGGCDELLQTYADSEAAAEAVYYKAVIQGCYLRDERAAVQTFQRLMDWYPESFQAKQYAPKMLDDIRKNCAVWRELPRRADKSKAPASTVR